MWLYIALSGYLILAVVSVLDKFIVSGGRMRPVVVTFYSTATLLPIFLLLPFGVTWITDGFDWFVVLVSGLAFALALWTMYISFEESEVSHAGPLIGASMAFFATVLSYVLHEAITVRAYVAILLLIVGSGIISFEQSKAHRGWHRGMLWGIAAGFFFALSNVAAKIIYSAYGFYSGLVWTRGAIGVVGILLIFFPHVWRSLFQKKPALQAAPSSPPKPFFSKTAVIVLIDKVLSVVGVVIVQYATALGSVAIVNALVGVEYALLIVLVAILSRLIPRLFKEEYKRGEVLQEGIAVIIISVGLALIII